MLSQFQSLLTTFLFLVVPVFSLNETTESSNDETRCFWGYYSSARIKATYSTWMDESDGARDSLTKVGATINISPEDDFDFIPEIGHGKLDNLRREFLDWKKPMESPTAFIIESGLGNEGADWAKQFLGNEVEKTLVPLPESDLVGVELVVQASKDVVKSEDHVLCHAIERGAYHCHYTDNLEIIEVTVVPKGKKEVLWVGCHDGYGCHVMNAGDKVFIKAKEEFKMSSLRGDI
eukprot:CAMPEP_0178953984 /NCGR_PEP_ID=MMETSP0789-20121207/8731_1 /TAXON_ID=3005 /ORGANISM="Rhizosolenia setigera, Strain CCMP 1694" /LENGTH=233 /DNA_ID=CAMNT_0020635321 /DNA_START=185 /DNA_END=886 /DNA_ORIENTATION=-